jgi:hypothetical protein
VPPPPSGPLPPAPPPTAPLPPGPLPPAPLKPPPARPSDPRSATERPADEAPTLQMPPISEGPTPTLVDVPAAPPEPGTEPGPLYAVGDVHGYRTELVDSLREQGLIDADENWVGGRSRVYFLGDFTDRGPDGIGVIDLVRRLGDEAPATGGQAIALLGNHELLLLGAKKFGDTPVHSTAGTASFLAAWRLNGGQQRDLEHLDDTHLTWLMRLPPTALVDDYLLLHSDTTAYLEYGRTGAELHDRMWKVLHQGDAEAYWEAFRKLTKRFAFRGDKGTEAVHELLGAYGGSRIVHGHSPIPYLTGAVDAEDGHPAETVTDPYVYAEDLAIAMDGGVTMEGPMLVRRLPLGS